MVHSLTHSLATFRQLRGSGEASAGAHGPQGPQDVEPCEGAHSIASVLSVRGDTGDLFAAHATEHLDSLKQVPLTSHYTFIMPAEIRLPNTTCLRCIAVSLPLLD